MLCDINMFELVCRLCLKRDVNHLNVFNNDVDPDIKTLIDVNIGISIKEDDELTTSICRQCFYMVKAFCELKTSAVKNDLQLKNDLEERKKVAIEQNKNDIKVCTEFETNHISNLETNIISTEIHDKINTVCDEVNKLITVANGETEIASKNVKQNFMTQLSLTKYPSKQKTTTKKCRLRYHPSVSKIKTLYPSLNIPKKCFKWHFDPRVVVNNKIVEDWLIQNSKISEHGSRAWTVNHKENKNLKMSFTRVPENTNIVFNDFDDAFDRESVLSETKSDSSFSPLTSLYGTDDSDQSCSSVKNSKSSKNRLRKRKVNSEESGSSAKISKISKGNEISAQNKQGSQILNINNKQLAAMKRNILEALLHKNGKEETVAPQISTLHDQNINIALTKETKIMPGVENKESLANNKYNKSTSTKSQTSNDTEFKENHFTDQQHERMRSENEKEENYDNLLFVETSYTTETFICQTCNTIFDTRRALNDHKRQHQKSSLRCHQCSESFHIVEDLIKHSVENHPSTSVTEISENSRIVGDKLDVDFDIQSKRIAKKSTSKNNSSKLTDNTSVLKDLASNIDVPFEITPSLDNKIEQYVISSDEETETVNTNTRKKLNKSKNENGNLTLNSLLKSNNIHSNVTDSNTEINRDIFTKPAAGKTTTGSSPFSSISLSDEEIYLKSVFNKHKNKKVTNTDLTNDGKVTNTGYVILNGLDKLLEKTYVPVEMIPRLDNMDLTLRYNFNSNQRAKPKNTSYKWCNSKAIDAPKNVANLHAISNTNAIVPEVDKTINPSGADRTISIISLVPSNQYVESVDKRLLAKMISHGQLKLQSVPANSKTSTQTKPNITATDTIQKNLQSLTSQQKPMEPRHVYPAKLVPVNNLITTTTNTVQIVSNTPTTVNSILKRNSTVNSVPNVHPSAANDLSNSNISNGLVSVHTVPIVKPTYDGIGIGSNITAPLQHILIPHDKQSVNFPNFISLSLPTSTGISQQSQVISSASFTTAVTGIQQNMVPVTHIGLNQTNSTITSDESSVTTSKPLLRIKNISELRDSSTSQVIHIEDRDSLQNSYAQTVSEYVSTYSSTHTANNTMDEYLQI